MTKKTLREFSRSCHCEPSACTWRGNLPQVSLRVPPKARRSNLSISEIASVVSLPRNDGRGCPRLADTFTRIIAFVFVFFTTSHFLLSTSRLWAADMTGGGYSLSVAADSGAWWHTRDAAAKGAWAAGSFGGGASSSEMTSGIYTLSGGFARFDPQHYVYQSKSAQGEPTRTGPNAFGFNEDAVWEWDVPVKAGAALTITAYIRYNTAYGAATKPKLTLSGRGITTTSVSASVAAENAWELLTLNAGTPSQNATLTLRAEGFSTTPAAKFYIDDIAVNQ